MTRRNLITKFLKDNPDTPIQTLAKVLFKKNHGEFKSVEEARDSLRYYAGKMGDKHRKMAITKENRVAKPHPFTVKSLAKPIEFFQLPIKKGCGVILSDCHLPYHDESALSAALEYAKEKDVDFIFLNGDFVDCYPISRFTKEQNKAPYIYEIKVLLDFLDMLKSEFPKAKIFYKIGNHEKRHADYFNANAPMLFGTGMESFKGLLRLPSFEIDPITHLPDFEQDEDGDIFVKPVDRDIRVIAQNKITKIGNGPTSLYVLHGHERKMSSPVNAARAAFNKTSVNAIVGHFHQVSEHSERRLDGSAVTCWSIGCLQHLQPEYDPYNSKWEHGFGFLEVDGDDWDFTNKRIIKGKVRG